MSSLLPPFDPPYLTAVESSSGVVYTETRVDGSVHPSGRTTSGMASSHAPVAFKVTSKVIEKAKAPKPAQAEAALYLKVPFDQKDQAKVLGARWDAAQKKWYVPVGKDIDAFSRWWPTELK